MKEMKSNKKKKRKRKRKKSTISNIQQSQDANRPHSNRFE